MQKKSRAARRLKVGVGDFARSARFFSYILKVSRAPGFSKTLWALLLLVHLARLLHQPPPVELLALLAPPPLPLPDACRKLGERPDAVLEVVVQLRHVDLHAVGTRLPLLLHQEKSGRKVLRHRRHELLRERRRLSLRRRGRLRDGDGASFDGASFDGASRKSVSRSRAESSVRSGSLTSAARDITLHLWSRSSFSTSSAVVAAENASVAWAEGIQQLTWCQSP